MKHTCPNTIYGLALIGALVYNLQYAQGWEQILWGIAKSILWPAFLMYEGLRLLQI